jgi:Fe-S cluster assembly protein SufD
MTATTTDAASGAARPDTHGSAQHGLVAHSHGGPAVAVPNQSRAERLASFRVDDFPVPTGREEDWRFTPLDRLRDLHAGASADGSPLDLAVDAPAPVRVETVGRDDERLGRTGTPEDRVAAAAWCGFEKALVVTVPRGQVVETPVHVRLTGSGGLRHGHTLIAAEAGSTGVVVIDLCGSGALADNLEIDVADGAVLTLVTIEDWDDDAVHVGAHHARLGRDAKLKHIVVTLGGDVVRLTPSARFTAPGAEVELIGLYFADAGQHQEHRLFVDHAVPRCRSNVVYKGALQGDGAHTVWVGDVLIRAAAEGTDTYELNRNLVLTDGARADSVPNLEIETGEIVGAGHASATGRFDDEQLFYLQARGIPETEARRLVVRGFFNELIQRIGVPDVQERLIAAIESELASSMAGIEPGVDVDAEADGEVTR